MLLVILSLGCTGDPVDSGESCSEDEKLVNWDNFGAGFFAGYCRTCHSAGTLDRHGAPPGVDFDTEQEVRTYRNAIRRSTLEEGTMPVGGGVQTTELDALATFLECGL